MSCYSTTTTSNPRDELLFAVDRFNRLLPTDDMFDAYLDVRECLCALIESVRDPEPYGHSWSLVGLSQPDFMEFNRGYVDTLNRLKEAVCQCVELLP
jgi:hypothetical protein